MWLQKIEQWANRLPHPMALFIYLCVVLWVLSWWGSVAGWSAQHPVSQDVLTVRSLLSESGWVYMLTNLVKNFMSFAPVGPVIMVALAFSLAERSGLLPALINGAARKAPDWMLPVTVAFLGVMSSIAVDSGYVVLLPLCAAMFYAAGRHPLAGLALGFACVSGGFSANLMVGPVDAMLAGITTEALSMVSEGSVSVLSNYYFMVASVPLIVVVTVFVNHKWVEPYLNKSSQVDGGEGLQQMPPSVAWGAWFWLSLLLIVIAWCVLTLPEQAWLRHPDTGSLVKGPFMGALVAMIAVSVALLSTVFGRVNNTLKGWKDWVSALEQGVKDLAPYLVLMFVVAQFVAWFKWSGLGPILAVHLAGIMESWELSSVGALLAILIFTAFLNLFIGSASAKWGLLAPVLVPAFYLLGVPAEAVQGAYRVADSSTNIITPLMPYFPLVLAFALKYDAQVGVGRILTMMLPYALSLLVAWGALLGVWLVFEIPFGP